MTEEKKEHKDSKSLRVCGCGKKGGCDCGGGGCGEGKDECCSEGALERGGEGGWGNGWGGCFSWGHTHSWWCLIKVLVVLSFIGAVFAAGVAAGIIKARFHSNSEFGVFGRNSEPGAFNMKFTRMMGGDPQIGTWEAPMMSNSSGRGVRMMGGFDWGEGEASAQLVSRVFGVITSIAGNTITVTDNSGASQVVISKADTVIMFGPEELTLGSLKAGQTITAIGSRDTDKNLTATIIQISGVGQ